MRGERCCGWPPPCSELSTGWKRRGCCRSPPELADFSTLLGLSTDLHALFQQTGENPRPDDREPGRNGLAEPSELSRAGDDEAGSMPESCSAMRDRASRPRFATLSTD